MIDTVRATKVIARNHHRGLMGSSDLGESEIT